MHSKLILEAFEKAMAIELETGILTPSKTSAAEKLSDFIEQEMNFQFGERRLRDYYNAASQGEDIELKQKAVRDGLAKFLDYADFSDFLIRNSEEKKVLEIEEIGRTSKGRAFFLGSFFRRNRTTVLIILGCLLAYFILDFVNKEKWMKWDGNEFVETDFDSKELENGQIFLFNKSQMEHFNKIQPDCNTQFFNSEGNPQIWYGKNRKGELEFFTDLGKHPETGKTLKPITQYMIDKYVCKEK
ncbi:hypothetical protein EI546_13535 [Aequorivita sp. H23M31]|uniref:Uncharacterized protein n=1 Tax=Aequorivita ciconiae TaxID=2494375 RepID=A0A410G5X0_9FLAO|nr:hypothetical protein [Aequorivita sp. H23M31]QAA82677.1 hypothetical protein EI546_13535 [Aequorivita sp. H23M31]